RSPSSAARTPAVTPRTPCSISTTSWASPTGPSSVTSCRTVRRIGPSACTLAARQQPVMLPGVRERWKFIAPTLHKAPLLQIVPMLGSLGCPYTCSFCIDAAVPYQPLDCEVMQEDLRFLVRTLQRPRVAWHDPKLRGPLQRHHGRD